MKKCLCLFLALSLVLCGCSDAGRTESGYDASDWIGQPAQSGYFEPVWRANVDYNYLVCEDYDMSLLKTYTDPIYTMAENGGSPEEFEEADYDLRAEMYYIYTLFQLTDLAWCRDPADESLTEQLTRAEECWRDAYDEYFLAMSALALSEHSELIKSLYHESYVEYFAAYDPELSQQQSQNAGRESELISRYYSLMSQEVVDGTAVGEIFLELVELRNAAAEVYGYDSYADFTYENLYYRDYTPGDAAALYPAIKENFAPLISKYEESVWACSDKLLASEISTSPKAILETLANILPRISPELSEACDYLREYHLYDLGALPQKAQLGYTTTLYYYNQPFIFNAASGEYYDYMDTIHEFGHFANDYANSADLLFGMADMDLCELQSQGMEMLFIPFYGEIFGDLAGEARAYTLMSMLYSVVDGALYDEFQQLVYAEENLSLERVNEIYARLWTDYGYQPYPGYETGWMEVVHNFEQPFYYISYSVSALGALELYSRLSTDWDGAVDAYMKLCAMNTEIYYFSQAIAEAGLADVFDPAACADVALILDEAFQ